MVLQAKARLVKEAGDEGGLGRGDDREASQRSRQVGGGLRGASASPQGGDIKGAGEMKPVRAQPQLYTEAPAVVQIHTAAGAEGAVRRAVADLSHALTAARQVNLCLFFQNKTKNCHSMYLSRVPDHS